MLTARFAEFVANLLAERTFYPLCHNGLWFFAADASHAGGHWFESSSLHQKVPDFIRNQELFSFMPPKSDAGFLHFWLDPNADPNAEMMGKEYVRVAGMLLVLSD